MNNKTITIKEVAEFASVSQATVSRVINGQSS
ncbi:LacI family DNA-binding transcriptional regulator, partial [Vibrio astriarenae]